MYGWRESSVIPLRSAPSAKIFTGRSSKRSVIPSSLLNGHRKKQVFSEIRVAENSAHGFVEIRDSKIRPFAQAFFVTALDENRAATCGARAIDIAPAIAYDITPFRINVQFSCCAEDHVWSRLAATARLAVAFAGVIAHLDTVK